MVERVSPPKARLCASVRMVTLENYVKTVRHNNGFWTFQLTFKL